MPGSHDVTMTTVLPAERGSQLPVARDTARNGAFEWSFLGLFAILLALVTARHEMWRDELLAWLVVRDNLSLFDLFHVIRYEGHPALWYLVLYIPSHISWNPASMQVINYLFAVSEAWLILSARKLHWSVRALTIFSYFVFFQYGVIARNYMLSTLLLTAAARALLGERQHRKLAIIFLALAINTHIHAIPIAAALAIWAFGYAKLHRWNDACKLFHDKEFWIAFLVLMTSVATAYFTVRPPADQKYLLKDIESHSLPYNFLLAEGRAWKALLPISPAFLPAGLREQIAPMGHPSATASGFSLALFLLVAGALRGSQARCFFILAFTLELITMAVTVGDPPMRHLGMLFDIFIIALLIDAYTVSDKPARAWFPRPVASGAILGILTFQALAAIYASGQDWKRPFSEAKEVSSWLKQQGLDKNPLVVDHHGIAVVGYLERPSAYFINCKCLGSYVVYDSRVDPNKKLSLGDLSSARGNSALPVILVYDKLSEADVHSFGLVEIHSFASKAIVPEETFTVYEQEHP